ncbi:hypothetical protein [Aquabacterium sp. CECT 9606]|uniref:hypothetical protein n=1 Tax=Aquabacterium sp. CECT 9606 TaxID=2845822 RepID=UPI001E304400|nr:hypothetical protein [Aquabacterium sp. CECT 9606]CAH0353032.1 hypothetical protein AQB9606_03026 [Aquabacterium sp. CECT 9606]
MSNTDTENVKTKPEAKAAKPAAAPAKKVATKKPPKAKAAAPAPAAKKAAPRAATAKPTVVATTPVKINSPAKVKQKLVRDSFTMPRADFSLINSLKERALTFRRPTKKSELLRAGLHALSSLPDAKLKLVLEGLVPLKTGRPKKGE